jgi:seryl-tRNA synthetase|tara:strand:+ start:852 stop:1223 length:372 start_codon:yes stop_codon:yes gene_type:complete
MANFRGEDKKLQREAEGLVAKYNEILKIFSNIANSTAQKRINYIDHVKSHMKSLEKKVKEQDAYIKSQAKKLKDAIDRTVSLDGVEDKIESKLIKYLQKEVNKNKKTIRNDEGALGEGGSGIF